MDHRRHSRVVGDDRRHDDPHDHSDQAAGARHHGGFNKKLRGDIALTCSQGAADADFAGSLGDRREHDVHDPDPADQERNPRDRAENEVEDPLRGLGFFEEFQRHGDAVIHLGMGLFQEAADRGVGAADVLHRVHLHGDLAQFDPLGAEAAALFVDDEFPEAGAVGG